MKLSNKLLIAIQISDLSAAISGGLSSPDFTSLGRALSLYIKINVVDPDLLNPDTNADPAVHVNPDPDTDTPRGFDEQKIEKIFRLNFFFSFFDRKLQFTCP
jgi:hypothetical protein